MTVFLREARLPYAQHLDYTAFEQRFFMLLKNFPEVERVEVWTLVLARCAK